MADASVLELNISAGRIETLYVWPSLAGRGIGTTLLIHAERILLEHGVSQVEIEASLVLYERLLRRGSITSASSGWNAVVKCFNATGW